MPFQLPQVSFTSLRSGAHMLALAAVAAFACLLIWALGPASLLEHMIGSARRDASVFMGLIGVFIGLGLMAGGIALLRGRPGWSIGFAGLPLLVLFLMLIR